MLQVRTTHEGDCVSVDLIDPTGEDGFPKVVEHVHLALDQEVTFSIEPTADCTAGPVISLKG